MTSDRVLYLPGSGGEGRFWQPVAGLVAHPGDNVLFDWPGFGPNPARAGVTSADDLYRLVQGYLDRPVDIVAQSMGGLFALRAALEHPDVVRRQVSNRPHAARRRDQHQAPHHVRVLQRRPQREQPSHRLRDDVNGTIEVAFDESIRSSALDTPARAGLRPKPGQSNRTLSPGCATSPATGCQKRPSPPAPGR